MGRRIACPKEFALASAITHFAVGALLALPAVHSKAIRRTLKPWMIPVTAGVLAVAPDLDTYLVSPFQVARGTLFAHRGFFHSILFLSLFCTALALIVARRRPLISAWWMAALWAISAITHPLLDMLTDGGPGVMLLYPITEQRLFFPWRPIHVSPLSVARFFSRAGYILKSELPFIGGALVLGVAGWLRSRRNPAFGHITTTRRPKMRRTAKSRRHS